MNISFTGIKNVDIKTFKTQGYGFYLNNAKNLEEGDKFYTIVSVKADLDGTVLKGENPNTPGYQPHILQYFEVLQKLKHFVLAQKILGIENQDKIEITMKHFHAPDNLGDIERASFMLNGQDIPILHRNVLPLYSFMARVTKDILNFFDLSPKARRSVQLMNDSITNVASDFIENMNL